MRRERARQLAARAEELTDEQRGQLVLVLVSNAWLTIVAQAGWVVLVLGAGRRVLRQRGSQPRAKLRAFVSPGLMAVTGSIVVKHVSRPILIRILDYWVETKSSANRS